MLITWVISLLFFSAGIVMLASGLLTFLNYPKAPANRAFFALTATIMIWSSGMALSIIASTAETCEIFRRLSAVGWSTAYAVLLHFVLIITGRSKTCKKWQLLCLYLPSAFTLFVFAVPNNINPNPYNLKQTAYGWINTASNNIWDLIFYAYYIGYTLTGLLLLIRWGKESSDSTVKEKSRYVSLSVIAALVCGTITDVVLGSMLIDLPQIAPIVILIPVMSIHHILQRDSFGITEGIDKKTSYIGIFAFVFVHIFLTAFQTFISIDDFYAGSVLITAQTARGVLIQVQMLISMHLVLKENKPGYIVSVIVNSISLVSSVEFIIRKNSPLPIPGIFSYLGVIIIITLFKAYKDKNSEYIKRINTQTVREQFYSSIFKQAPVGIAIMDDKNHTRNEELEDININPMYARILGRTKEELQTTSWEAITFPEDLDTDLAYFDKFKKGEIEQYSMEKRFIKPDGSNVWVNMHVSPFITSEGKTNEHVCIITDITKRKEIEATLKYNNEHDLLTGLYNRSVLENRLDQDAKMCPADKRALVGINLAAMHILSLRYGFNNSQDTLRKIADSLKVLCTDKCTLYSTHENQFVFYIKGYKEKNELAAFCEAVSITLNSHLYIHGIFSGIGVIEICESHLNSTEELLKMLLVTSEKATRRNSRDSLILFYGPEIKAQANREYDISRELTEISEGINTDRLFILYQPIYDLTSDRICGFEALARLKSEKYGLVLPLEFISIADKSNMIIPLGDKIISKTFNFLRILEENGHKQLTLSVNVSTIQMLDKGFANRLLNMAHKMRINPENIGIELTESIFAADWAEINTVITKLKSFGIKISIDDFGTGYSSFARERDLNIDSIKIDKSFIDRLLVLKPEEAITGDIISMAHKMGHDVVAEGVEYEKQLSYLKDHGCDMVQGYLISKPLSEEEALKLMEKTNMQAQ